MSGELRNFDPDLVRVTWALPLGAFDLTRGLIDGPGAIAITKDAPRWSRANDRQGNYVRNKSRKRGGFLTLTYKAESAIHDALTGYMIADDTSEAVVGLITIKDLNGTTKASLLASFIEDDPPENFGDTAADRPWLFGFARRDSIIGGATRIDV